VSQLGKNLNHLYGGDEDRDVWEYLQKLIGYVISMPPDKKSDWDESYMDILTVLCPDEKQYKQTIIRFNLLLDEYNLKLEDKISSSNLTYRQIQKVYLNIFLLLHENTVGDCAYTSILFYLREFYRPLYENIKNREYNKDDANLFIDMLESVPSGSVYPRLRKRFKEDFKLLSGMEQMLFSFIQCVFEQEFQNSSLDYVTKNLIALETATQLRKIQIMLEPKLRHIPVGNDVSILPSLCQRREIVSMLCMKIDSIAVK